MRCVRNAQLFKTIDAITCQLLNTIKFKCLASVFCCSSFHIRKKCLFFRKASGLLQWSIDGRLRQYRHFKTKDSHNMGRKSWLLAAYKCQTLLGPKITMERLAGAGRLGPYKYRSHLVLYISTLNRHPTFKPFIIID